MTALCVSQGCIKYSVPWISNFPVVLETERTSLLVMRFQFFTEVKIKTVFFWVITQFSLVSG
jgi:hypothetical protein